MCTWVLLSRQSYQPLNYCVHRIVRPPFQMIQKKQLYWTKRSDHAPRDFEAVKRSDHMKMSSILFAGRERDMFNVCSYVEREFHHMPQILEII